MEHVREYVLPKGWTGTQAREELTRLADDVARLLDPSRPPLGEPTLAYESEEQDAYGEWSDTTDYAYGEALEVSATTSGINDGATPSSDSLRGTALGLPEGSSVSFHASHRSPVHVQPSTATVTVALVGDALPAAIAERLDGFAVE